jgi:hypothetical protein
VQETQLTQSLVLKTKGKCTLICGAGVVGADAVANDTPHAIRLST